MYPQRRTRKILEQLSNEWAHNDRWFERITEGKVNCQIGNCVGLCLVQMTTFGCIGQSLLFLHQEQNSSVYFGWLSPHLVMYLVMNISLKSVKNYSVFDIIKTEVKFTFWISNFRKGRLSYTEWDKVWSRLSLHLQPFFLLIARILTIFDKKYHILMLRDKWETYLIILQQNNV